MHASSEAPRARHVPDPLPPGAGLSMKRVDHQLHFADGLPLVYVQNNKAACTSIKYSLLQSIVPPEQISDSALHWRGEGPFSRWLSGCSADKKREALRRPMFTAVRNPYTRILSAYLDKMRLTHSAMWAFCRRYYLNPDPEKGVSFIDFLRCVASDHPRAGDAHYTPQYANTLPHHLSYDFVGSVEDIGTTADYLRGHGIELRPWQRHATGAAALLERHYTDEAMALVREHFAEDFRLYGYPLDLARAGEPPDPGAPPPRRGVTLEDFLVDPERCEQPESQDMEAQRRFALARDPEQRQEIAAGATGFDDPLIVKSITNAMIGAEALDVAASLLDRLVVIRTQHMEHVPEGLLSEHGRALKRRREAVLSR